MLLLAVLLVVIFETPYVMQQTATQVEEAFPPMTKKTTTGESIDNSNGRCPLSHRKQFLDAYCAAPHDPGEMETFIKSKSFLSLIHARLVVDDKHKLIYCPISKIGSTTWLRYLNSAMGHGELNHTTDQSIKRLSMYSAEEADYRLKNYMKIMVARHPLDRLVSAYNDKVGQSGQTDQMEYLRPLIIDRVRNGITHISPDQYKKYFRADRLYGVPDDPILKQHLEHYDDYVRVNEIGNPYRVNFTEFILYVTQHAVGRVTEHWITMEHTCWPCYINYDVILKMETITDDSEYVIKHMESVAPVLGYKHLPHLHSHRSFNQNTWDSTEVYGYIQNKLMKKSQTEKPPRFSHPLIIKQLAEFQDVSKDLIKHLLEKVYWNDMIMFGYDFNIVKRLAECSFEDNDHSCC